MAGLAFFTVDLVRSSENDEFRSTVYGATLIAVRLSPWLAQLWGRFTPTGRR